MTVKGEKRKAAVPICVGIAFLFLLSAQTASAQTDISRTDYGKPSLVAPAYFGPNAFPVPPMLDGSVQSVPRLELAADGYLGYEGDLTYGPYARLNLPLFSDRATLTVWMPVMEWYRSTEQRLTTCRVHDENRAAAMQGHQAGDVYVSTDMALLRESQRRPAVAVRAAVKTASGGQFELARTYDAPGYFFDVAVGKSFSFDTSTSLRLAVSTGFLCWQTDRGRQDDAVQYGLLLRFHRGAFSLEETLAGYVGWEVGDKPMTLASRVAWHGGAFEPYLMYQYGLMDYPFHQLRVGVVYYFNTHKH